MKNCCFRQKYSQQDRDMLYRNDDKWKVVEEANFPDVLYRGINRVKVQGHEKATYIEHLNYQMNSDIIDLILRSPCAFYYEKNFTLQNFQKKARLPNLKIMRKSFATTHFFCRNTRARVQQFLDNHQQDKDKEYYREIELWRDKLDRYFFLQFVAAYVAMGINTRPCWRDHYTTTIIDGPSVAKKLISRNNFALWLRFLNLSGSLVGGEGVRVTLYCVFKRNSISTLKTTVTGR